MNYAALVYILATEQSVEEAFQHRIFQTYWSGELLRKRVFKRILLSDFS